MVEILCPHCEEEIGLDDDAVGEFSCPYCNEDFTYDGIIDGESDYDWKSFWFSFGTPILFIILAWILAVYLDGVHERAEVATTNYSDDALQWLHLMSLLSWITFLIYGIKEKNKAMWQGALTAIAAAPAVLLLGIVYYLEATNWSVGFS